LYVVTGTVAGSAVAAVTAVGQARGPVRVVQARAETEGSLQDDGNDVAFWIHSTDPARSLVLASGGTAGLEAFALDGRRVAREGAAEIDFVAVSHAFTLDGRRVPLVVGYDRRSRGLLAWTIDPGSYAITRVSTVPFETAGEVTGLCTYRSPLTGAHYAFASSEGQVEQWKLVPAGREVRGQLVRRVPVGIGAGYCAVDDPSQTLFVTEETVGIWRLAAEPETEAERAAVDLVAPFGTIEEEVKGLAVYRADGKQGYLVAADAKPGRFNVYSIEDGSSVGSFRIDPAAGDLDGVTESEGLALTPAGLPGGLLAVFDEDNEGGAGNIKLVEWARIAEGLGLAVAADVDPNAATVPSTRTAVPAVETEPVQDFGDAADDPAVWVHPTDPALSLVIGTNKKRGLDVYDLDGRRVQALEDGRMNNVDLRNGFDLGGHSVTLLAASNRTTKSLAFYRIDPATRRLSPIGTGPVPTGLSDPYGLCLYRNARSGATYVFVNDSADGRFRQWRLIGRKDRIDVKLVREFSPGSQSEGCVADDEAGVLYAGEEDVGLWRYSAEPDGGVARRLVDSVTPPGRLTADVEGLGLYVGAGGRGYLVVSNQGADNYAVYRREGDNEFIGYFDVVANDELGIDGVSETDGLDVTSSPLGNAFPRGVLVVQDGRNITPAERQNFKLVPWERVLEALGAE
jgi:3-phytase